MKMGAGFLEEPATEAAPVGYYLDIWSRLAHFPLCSAPLVLTYFSCVAQACLGHTTLLVRSSVSFRPGAIQKIVPHYVIFEWLELQVSEGTKKMSPRYERNYTGSVACLAVAILFFSAATTRAEDGYRLWLRYDSLPSRMIDTHDRHSAQRMGL